MRTPVTVTLSAHSIDQARLYAAGRSDSEAVQHLLDDYPRLVSEIRELRRRVSQLDDEGTAIDARLDALQAACRSILDL